MDTLEFLNKYREDNCIEAKQSQGGLPRHKVEAMPQDRDAPILYPLCNIKAKK